MKTSLIALLASASIAVFSTVAMANDGNCDSKKGAHGKDMSAEAMKEFRNNHPWINKDEVKVEQSTVKQETGVKI